MKRESTGKFKTREELEDFVIAHHLKTGATAATARLSGVKECTVVKIKKKYYQSLQEPVDCPKCHVKPSIEPLRGGMMIGQCQECGECGKASQNHTEAVQQWNEKARSWAAEILPRRLGK